MQASLPAPGSPLDQLEAVFQLPPAGLIQEVEQVCAAAVETARAASSSAGAKRQSMVSGRSGEEGLKAQA